ncbi:serine/threonine protein kinase, partial [Nostoc sp. NIES-2111]
MNLIAGRKALASTAYTSAIKYLTTGIQLLADNSWENQYQLTLALYETAAEATYLAGDFEQMEKFIQVVLVNAKSSLEQVRVYEVKIQAYGAQNQALEAVHTALNFLKVLGVEFPKNPCQSDIQIAMAEIASHMNGRSIEELIHLPQMSEAQPLAVMRILSSAIALAYQAVPELFPLIVLKQVNLSLQYGNAVLSAFAYVAYGLMLAGILGDINSGYQFGKLAENLLSTLPAKQIKARVIETFNQLIKPAKEHIKNTLEPLLDVYSIGLETGDLEFAAYGLYSHCYHAYFLGQEMAELEQEMAKYNDFIKQIKQDRILNWHRIYQQTVLNLLGDNQEPFRLIGNAYDEEKMLTIHLETND